VLTGFPSVEFEFTITLISFVHLLRGVIAGRLGSVDSLDRFDGKLLQCPLNSRPREAFGPVPETDHGDRSAADQFVDSASGVQVESVAEFFFRQEPVTLYFSGFSRFFG
jgi:hypothetical protein